MGFSLKKKGGAGGEFQVNLKDSVNLEHGVSMAPGSNKTGLLLVDRLKRSHIYTNVKHEESRMETSILGRIKLSEFGNK